MCNGVMVCTAIFYYFTNSYYILLQAAPYKDHPQNDNIKHYLGKSVAHKGLPLKKVLATGANVLLSSDWDVNILSPLINIADALQNNNTFATVQEAIAAYTINPARALGLDHITGSIEVGKSADLVQLDITNISQLTEAGLRKAQVVKTWLEGEIVFRSISVCATPLTHLFS